MALTRKQSKERKDRLKRAAIGLALKLKYEKTLKSRMASYFDKIIKDFERQYKLHGIAINPIEYQEKLENYLIEHHIKVAGKFSHASRDQLGLPINNSEIQKKLDANIKHYAIQRAHSISHDMTETTRDNIDKSLRMAFADATKQELEISHIVIAGLAADRLRAKFHGRETTIAITETNTAAEKGKKIEHNTLLDLDAKFKIESEDRDTDDEEWEIEEGEERGWEEAGIIAFSVLASGAKKMWTAVLDDHTREWHAEADGQVVDADEPFIVNNEELMEPMDDSLGASDDNILNCRCSSDITYEEA
jgi:hypothetical protein